MNDAQNNRPLTLASHLQRYPSMEKFQLVRNFALSAAGTCLVIILLIAQLGQLTTPLKIAIYASVVGMPLWFIYAVVNEFYIILGKTSFSHSKSIGAISRVAPIALVAAVSLLAAISALLWHMLPVASCIFIVMLLFSGAFVAHYAFNILGWIEIREK